MAVFKLSAATRGAMASAVISAIDAGSGPALLKFYTGSMPAGPDTAVTSQVLLGTLTCSDPCGTQANGVITFAAITQDSSADASGTCTWARLETSDGTAVADFDVTDNGGAGSIKLNVVTIVAGGPITMTSLTVTMGGA